MTMRSSPDHVRLAGTFPAAFDTFDHRPRSGLWQDGTTLIVAHGAPLPADRCIQCNAPAVHWLARKLSWLPSGAALLLLVSGLLLYVIIAAKEKKTAPPIKIGLCEHHRQLRLCAIVAGWGVGLLGALVMVVAMTLSWWELELFLVSFLLVLLGSVGGHVGARVVYPTKIDGQYTYLAGVAPAYLASIARVPGPARVRG
jgi:hypothetical protein